MAVTHGLHDTHGTKRIARKTSLNIRNVCENYHGNVNGCNFQKFTGMEVK